MYGVRCDFPVKGWSGFLALQYDYITDIIVVQCYIYRGIHTYSLHHNGG